jgi:hypothetical protein
LICSRLKPGAFNLWVKLDSTCTAPPLGALDAAAAASPGVAVQVEFESKV